MNRSDLDTASVDQLVAGYTQSETAYCCLFCATTFARGYVYPQGTNFVEAELAMRNHVAEAHRSPFHALLELGKKGTGLSDIQRTLLSFFHDGLSDKEIRPLAGGVSLSTIRNHRYALREKARQAKVQVALMDLLTSTDQDPETRFVEIPGKKAADDERFAITRAEYRKIIAAHFPDGPEGPLSHFPRKEKRKIAVLLQIRQRFDATRHYTQTEVNEILASASEDYTTLCRYLVDYGFLGRTRDGSEYWVE